MDRTHLSDRPARPVQPIPEDRKDDPPKLYSVAEVAELNNLSAGYLRHLISRGEVEVTRVRGRVGFTRDQILAMRSVAPRRSKRT